MKTFYKLSNGTIGPYPEGRPAAAGEHSRLYTDLKKCENCKSLTFITASGRCVACMRDQIVVTYSLAFGHNVPVSVEPSSETTEAVKLLKSGRDFELARQVCRGYGHVKLTNSKHPKCYFCETQTDKKKQALLYDDECYLTRSKCSGCDNVTMRKTVDSSCVNCGYLPGSNNAHREVQINATTEMMLSNPDMLISREEAKMAGLTVYRTGNYCKRGHNDWRYVSTGNCLECLKK
jgi:hypothetical protein